eukprot:TRINITY_DN16734_c0_g1_i1.p2 TRINITY_DN16734_c0_g1~~TRINITY_DN16734_c0_g1_i1.p2  ORF type:complete len:252 (-),score=45.61 TRINITY_DN16734_c0_g1_i1:42-797(-)
MPMNASFGVFPSQSAVRSKSCTDLQRLYFQTSQRSEFDWRTIPEADRPENFDQLHNIGKRNTKYMKYQRSTAPNVDRTACVYMKEFAAKPLGDCECNKALAQTFKGPSKVASSPSFGIRSNYKETYVLHSPEELKGARLKSQAPKQLRTKTLGGTDDFMEPVSESHASHPVYPLDIARAAPAMIPKPNLTMVGQGSSDLYKSQYSRDFRKARPKASSDAPFEEFLPQPSPFMLADDGIYKARRAVYLSPGN